MKRIAVCFFLLSSLVPASAAFGQNEAQTTRLLSGDHPPYTLKLKDLNATWLVMRLATANSGVSFLTGMLGGGAGQETPIYYSRGQTLNLVGETFLVAYSHDKAGLSLMEMALQSAKSGGNKEPEFAKLAAQNKLTAESSLSLSLINVKTLATLSGFRPFDVNQEIAESAKGAGGLLQLIADQTAKEKQAAKPILARPAPPKRAAPPRKL